MGYMIPDGLPRPEFALELFYTDVLEERRYLMSWEFMRIRKVICIFVAF